MPNLPTKEQLPLYATICLGIAALLLAAQMLHTWYQDWEVAFRTTAKSPAAIQEDQTTKLVSAIPEAHLFGHAFANSQNAPLSNLQFHLTGIVKTNSNSGKNVSKAYISTSGQPSKIVEVGDELPYGVKVYDITDDTVILENDGHLEKLTLQRSQLEFKPRPAVNTATGAQP